MAGTGRVGFHDLVVSALHVVSRCGVDVAGPLFLASGAAMFRIGAQAMGPTIKHFHRVVRRDMRKFRRDGGGGVGGFGWACAWSVWRADQMVAGLLGR